MKHKLMYTSPVIKKLDSIMKGTQAKKDGDLNDGGSISRNKCKRLPNGKTTCS